MKDFKIGDKVKLDASTKPYTYTTIGGDTKEKADALYDEKEYTIVDISKYDGDIYMASCRDDRTGIQPRHLTHVEEEFNKHLYELRLDIFKTNPNLSVSDMQEIEKWLLNK